MISDKQRAELDQAAAAIKEFYPPLLWGLFTNLKEQGFTDAQSLYLTGQYLCTITRPSGPSQPT